MRRGERALVAATLLLAGCARHEPGPTAVRVGAMQVTLTVPAGWEHVDHDVRHEFRLGELKIVLRDAGIATPETLAASIRAAQALWRGGRPDEAVQRVSRLDAPVLALADADVRGLFWRHWNDVSYDPTRAGTFEMDAAFDTLAERTGLLAAPSGRALVLAAFAAELDTLRYEIESLEVRGEGGERWSDARTWGQVAHGDPARFACRTLAGHVLVLESTALRDPRVARAFDTLLDSIEPASP
jgi:hypothetical protein